VPNTEELPSHVERSIADLVQLHEQHREGAGTRLRFITHIADLLSRPATVIVVALGMVLWLPFSSLAGRENDAHSAFEWLELSAALAGLVVALVILITQRHQEAHAERRAELTLELALVADKRAAKIIALVEELRRDLPSVSNRHDAESVAMAQPSDPQSVLAALEEDAQRK